MPDFLSHSETELLQRAARGDQPAFAQLFMLNRHKLFSFLMRLTQSPEMTEDVIQDIFLKLWRNRETLTTIDSFSSYIFRMAQNQCISHFKRVAKEALIIASMGQDALPAQTATEDSLALKEVQQQLVLAINKLTPQQKLVFSLSREKGLKHEEIARELNISTSTVKNHMIEALRVIRQQLKNKKIFFFI